jgi:DNA-binding MarR family transcriptional regulator
MNLKKEIFSSKNLPLTKMDMEILKMVYKNITYNQKNLAKDTKSSIAGICKSLKRLEKYGFIYIIPHPIKIYQLIPERREEVKNLISGYDFGKNSPFIVDAHCFIFECEVKEFSKKFEERLKHDKRWLEFTPKNWKGYKQEYLDGSTLFHKTKNRTKVRFYFRTFAPTAKIAEMININKFLERKKILEVKYPGLKIGNFECIARMPFQHVALLQDPLSKEAIILGVKSKEIEDSHHIGGEWEEKNKDAIEKIEILIDQRKKDLEEI